MQRAPPSDRSAFDEEGDDDAQTRRRFGQLRKPAIEVPPPASLELVEPEPETADSAIPFDSVKTFVGPNGTYYDERWRWMEWRGKEHSWNWSAALSFGVWFAYRRLYVCAALFLAWLMVVLTMALTGANLRLLAIAHVLVAVIVGRYGNTLYRQRFRRFALKVAQRRSDHGERIETLGRAGGVDPLTAWSMVLAIFVGAVVVIWRIRSSSGIHVAW